MIILAEPLEVIIIRMEYFDDILCRKKFLQKYIDLLMDKIKRIDDEDMI